MPKKLDPTLTALDSAKYYCTLSTYEYKRPAPFLRADHKPLRTFKLPLPSELRDETRIDYASENMQVVGDILNNGVFSPSMIAAEALRQSGQIMSSGVEALSSKIVEKIGGGEAVGNAVTEALSPELLGSALEQKFGIAPNPNPAVAFKGVPLREMGLSWVFMPANRDDARQVRTLVKYLKKSSLPKSGEGSSSILSYPSLVQLNFYPWDTNGNSRWGWGANSIIKMKRCFMGSVNVDYSQGIAPAFFHDDNNEPVITRLNIQFKEVEQFLYHDYSPNDYREFDLATILGNIASLAGDLVAGGNDSTLGLVQSALGEVGSGRTRDNDVRDAADT
jgi:hypothetical protein